MDSSPNPQPAPSQSPAPLFIADDGGRAAAGWKGEAGDCGCRALAIAAEMPYQDAYDLLNGAASVERPRKGKTRSSARNGYHATTYGKVLASLGWKWTPCMAIGQGCTVHVRADELPAGRLILRLSRHFAAFVDGVLHDTHDSSREGTRCVYGYWSKEAAAHE